MSRYTLLPFVAFALSTVVRSQQYFSPDPLVDKVVPYDAIPYQVMTDTDDPRGFETNYNICNSTTQNQESLCGTMFVNHADDWCLWAPPLWNSTISDEEANVVAFCSKNTHGTRVIPNGAITGFQLIQTPSYILVAGTVNQVLLNMVDGDYGGELDSGGQDGEGNPMGGLIYSNAFPSNNGNNATFQQVQHWSFFIGSNTFCGKVCDQTGSNPQGLCNNIYDRLGCDYNAPNTATEGVFEACQGADMTPVGVYVGADGVTSTYTQPAESVAITSVPYTATVPAISNCVTFASTDLFADGLTVSAASPTGGASATGTASGAGSAPTGTGAASGTNKATGGASSTGSGSASKPTGANGAAALGMSFGAIAVAMIAILAQN